MEPLKLLLIRHAQSIGNQQRRMQGQSDFELSAEGRAQAERLARRLISESRQPAYVYSSPLKRAAQTTEILLTHFLAKPLPTVVSDLVDAEEETEPIDPIPLADIPIEYSTDLQEFQNGIFQGLTWAEARSLYPDLCSTLESSPDWIQIPGAESLKAARARARRFVLMLLDRHKNGEQIWIITHSWILQHLIAELMGCERSWRVHARNTAIFEFWIDRSRWHRTDQNRFNTDLWQIRRFNDCRHLTSTS